MKKDTSAHDKIDQTINQLSQSARSPQARHSASQSYPLLRKRIRGQKGTTRALIRYLGSAAAVAAVIVLSVLAYQNLTTPNNITVSTSDATREIVLSDGTKVILNHNSTLTYPERFASNHRNVNIEGEAYFEVSKDANRPFTVQAQGIEIEVLGTHFNVEAYASTKEIRTALIEGSVAVRKAHGSESIILKPNQIAIFDKTTGLLSQTDVENAAVETAWKETILIFDNLPLHDIAQQLSVRFDTSIEITDAELGKLKLTARFTKGENLDQILSLLQHAGNFNYTTKENNIVQIK